MGERKRRAGTGTLRDEQPPIPLDPVDLLAGIAPGVVLQADEASDADCPESAEVTVAEVGRMLRSGDATVRRLIRSAGIRPTASARTDPPRDVMRAGVPPRTPDKPGE